MKKTALRLIALSSLLVLFVFSASGVGTTTMTTAAAQNARGQKPADKEEEDMGIEGNWIGVLAEKLRLVLKISKGADGKLTATMDSLDQGAKDLTIDTLDFTDRKLRFEMKALGASFEGTLER